MRNIIILLTFLWAITSYAVAPYGIKGQQQAATLYSNVHQFPNNQVTNLGGINALVETGNTNILSNPSFEHLTFSTGWTNSAGTFTQETSVVIDGKASAKLVLAAQTMSLTQSSTLYAAQFDDGVQGLAMVRIKSDIALSVCSIQAGTVSTTNCVTTATDSKWGLYKVPFVMGATSQGISIASSGSVTGTVYIDYAFVGGINLESQNGACITSDCTTTFSAKISTTPTASDLNISAWVTSVAKSGTNNSIKNLTIPSGLFTVIPNCTCTPDATSTAADISCKFNPLGSTTTSLVFNTANNSVAEDRAIIVMCQKQGADFTQAEAKKTGNVFTTQCGANCVDTFSANVTAAGSVTSQVSDFISGSCSVTAAPNKINCTFKSGLFTVAPSCVAQNNGASTGSDLIATSTTTSGFSVNYVASVVREFNVICQKQGADFVATRTIQGTFSEMVTTPGQVKSGLHSAKLSAAGVVSSENGQFINGNCTCSTGNWTCSFNAGAWSTAPTCIAAGADIYLRYYNTFVTTTSSFTWRLENNAGAGYCLVTSIICHGGK
jgi:hypothetical protein